MSSLRVAVCFLTYNRGGITPDILQRAKEKAGYECSFIGLDQSSTDKVVSKVTEQVEPSYYFVEQSNIGVASGFNKLWKFAKEQGYDFIANVGNDIELPDNWLKEFVETFKAVDRQHQYAAIHSVESLPKTKIKIGTKEIIESDTIFGTNFFHTDLLDYVGYFNTKYNPYGLEDGEFTFRCKKLNVLCYYLPIGTAHHVAQPYFEHDTGEYRKQKDESLKKNTQIYLEETKRMNQENNYFIPFK